MKRNILLVIMICLSLLTGCYTKSFTPIPMDKEALISVNIKDGSLTFFDLNDQKRIAEWKLKQPLRGALLLPDRNRLLVYADNLETAYVFNLAEGKVEREWKVGKGIVNAVAANDRKHLVFVDERKGSLKLFTLKGKEIGEIQVGKKPLTILQNKQGNLFYVLNFNDDFLSVVDIQKQEVIDTFSIPKSSTGGVIREVQNELWIGGHGSGEHIQSNVHVYSLKTGQLLKMIPAPEMPIYFVETKHGVFVLSHGTNTLRKYNSQKKEAASLKVGSNPFSMAAHVNELYIASYDSDEIYQVDQQSLKIVNKLRSGNGPFQLIIREGITLGQKKSAYR
jgi:DNA-binding beta-propeller fold protein YncE